MKYKVSVIIPVYNTAMYLHQCIESLMHQSLVEIEYIFINDASTDDSLTILQDSQRSYPKKKIIIIDLKKNQGISFVRNLGIKNATGEYITHCDSDDWIEPKAYETLYYIAKQKDADIASCNFIHEYDTYKKICQQPYSADKYESIKRLLNGQIFPSLWTSIIKRDLIIEYNLQFPIGLNMGEDLYFNIQAYYYSKVIVATNDVLYHYRHTTNSVCTRRSKPSIESDIKIAGLIDAFLKNNGKNNEFKNELNYRKFYSKLELIRNFDNTHDYKEWLQLYPETHAYIFSFKQIEGKLRIQLWLASHHMFRLATCIKYFLIRQNQIRAYLGKKIIQIKRKLLVKKITIFLC